MHQKAQSKRNPLLLLALALLVLAVAIGGTIAWLTASNHVTNTFTVGQITQPDPGEGNGGDGDTPVCGEDVCPLPGGDQDTDGDHEPDIEASLDGNIYEVFATDPKLTPGTSVVKRPYIGIGKGSEDSFVFAYVDNKTMSTTTTVDTEDTPYFFLADGWKAVDGKATAAVNAEDVPIVGSNNRPAYVSGLFVWVGNTNEALALEGSETESVWTGKLFSEIVVPESTQFDDFNYDPAAKPTAVSPTIDVYCYLYAKVGEADAATATDQATAWAGGTGDYRGNKLGAVEGGTIAK